MLAATFLVPADAAQVQAMRGEGQTYHTMVAESLGDSTRLAQQGAPLHHVFRDLIKATTMVKGSSDAAGAVVKTCCAEWVLKKDAMHLAAAVRYCRKTRRLEGNP